MDEYSLALKIDVATVVACIVLLVRFGGLCFSHPGTAYILFHLHTVTIRLAALVNGASSLYSNWRGFYDPVRPDELARAALYCDFAFMAVTAAWIFVGASPKASDRPPATTVKLEPKILLPILALLLLAGIVGLRIAARIPGMEVYDGLGTSSESAAISYILILPTSFGLAVLAHIYYYGFRWYTNLLLTAYLVLMAIQGGLRFRVIVGILLAATIWVDRQGRRWPSFAIVGVLAAVGLLFFPMKSIGTMIQEGRSVSDVSTMVSESLNDTLEGSAADHFFLDEFASALTLLDVQGKKYYGEIYLPMLTLPIPRAWWPDKPKLAPFLFDISSGSRPMAQSGMITTYLGESYANFGIVGIFLVPLLLAVGLAWFRRRAYLAPYDSVKRFSYVLLSVNFIQIFRGGLQSIVVFTFVNMMPLMIVIFAHLAVSRFRKSAQPRLSLVGLQARPMDNGLARLATGPLSDRPQGDS